ncbi:hypothetical protein SEUCBS139899_001013 [Sporothrix eucalyptigena]|uniref:Uncharacterized protein n=1 Tax=Sporothrix eucalyptigena TaxID=1812306 RepID=A0ABP0CNF9_9PEZI
MKATTPSSRRPSTRDRINRRLALFLFATAAPNAASALSLSNFQLVTSSAVPINCLLAYNTQLTGCTLSDFTQLPSAQRLRRDDSNTCSLACQAGIALAQQTIQAVCGGSAASTTTSSSVTSVLGVALSGDLVGLLCGGSEAVSSDGSSTTTLVSLAAAAGTASDETTTEPFVFSTLQGGLPTVGNEGTSTDGVAQAPAAGAATATATPGLESQSFVQNTNTLSGVVATTTAAVSVGNAAPPSPPVMTAPMPLSKSTTSTSSSISSKSTSSSANDRNIIGGGGSPFDEAAANSGAERVGQLVDPWAQPWVMLVAAGAAVAGGVLFRW